MGILDSLLNLSPEQNRGLLGAATKILDMSAPSRVPRSTMQILAHGMNAFEGGVRDAQQQKLEDQLYGLKVRDAEADFEHQQTGRARSKRISNRVAGLGSLGGLGDLLGAGSESGAGGDAGSRGLSGYDTSYNGTPYTKNEAQAAMSAATGMNGYEPDKLNQVMALTRQGMSADEAASMVFGNRAQMPSTGGQQAPMSPTAAPQQGTGMPTLGSSEWMQGMQQQMNSAPSGQPGAPSSGASDWMQSYKQLSGLGLSPDLALTTAMSGGLTRADARGAPSKRPNQTQAWVQRLMTEAQIFAEEGDHEGAAKRLELVQKFRPNATWKEVRQGGRVVNMPFFDDGTAGDASDAEVAEKLQWQDVGQDTLGLDAFDGSVKARHRNSVAPNTAATIAAQRERTESERQQGRRPVYDAERGVMIDTRTGIASPVRTADGADFGTKEARQRTADSESVIDLLDSAGGLVKKATSSYGGMAVDQGARFFGGATDGAQAAAQLKAIEGMLISKMPKMSGPQSDKDVLLYRQMAGQIGDPTLPVRTKEAAMETIRAINNRHLGLPEDARRDGKGADGKFSVTAPNGKTYTFSNAKDLANFKLTAGIR